MGDAIGAAHPYPSKGGGTHSYFLNAGGWYPLYITISIIYLLVHFIYLYIAKVVKVEMIIPISYHVYLFKGGGGHPHLFCACGGANP